MVHILLSGLLERVGFPPDHLFEFFLCHIPHSTSTTYQQYNIIKVYQVLTSRLLLPYS